MECIPDTLNHLKVLCGEMKRRRAAHVKFDPAADGRDRRTCDSGHRKLNCCSGQLGSTVDDFGPQLISDGVMHDAPMIPFDRST